MLPFVAAGWPVVNCVPVEVVVPVKVVVVIDVDVAAAPVAIAPPTTGKARPYDHAGAPGQPHSRIIAGIRVGIVRIGRRTIDNRRIVGGDIDGFGDCLFGYNEPICDLLPLWPG